DIEMSGGFGDDTLVAEVRLDSGSTGRIGDQTSHLKGDSGDDKLTFLISDENEATIAAVMDGGGVFLHRGHDVGTHTRNVKTSGLEVDNVVNFAAGTGGSIVGTFHTFSQPLQFQAISLKK